MKYLILMYADPAATEAMTAAERAEVFHRHEALHQDLEGTGEMPRQGCGAVLMCGFAARARPAQPREGRGAVLMCGSAAPGATSPVRGAGNCATSHD
ncbi:hypothetical protein [Streptomyces sp. TLI_185]|uniref:hypothetical protein n=1 Tax=Streptomyces sp. TLI_185 TaxID=2485151 RepID=UPI000F4E07D9|nr:hypothetical protein [Streptomyces sp. TLI_185]RPF38665.1 hypothetical protein EDD92_8832 [Streptomyces sp. TLI_185]